MILVRCSHDLESSLTISPSPTTTPRLHVPPTMEPSRLILATLSMPGIIYFTSSYLQYSELQCFGITVVDKLMLTGISDIGLYKIKIFKAASGALPLCMLLIFPCSAYQPELVHGRFDWHTWSSSNGPHTQCNQTLSWK